MTRHRYRVAGLSSELGARHLRRALLGVDGVRRVRVYPKRHEVECEFERSVPLSVLNDTVRDSEEGYLLLPIEGEEQYERAGGPVSRLRRLFEVRA